MEVKENQVKMDKRGNQDKMVNQGIMVQLDQEECKVLQENQDYQEMIGQLDQKECKVLEENLVKKDKRGTQDKMVNLGQLDQKECVVHKENPVKMEEREVKEKMVNKEYQDIMVQGVLQDKLDQKEWLDHQEHLHQLVVGQHT